MLTPCAIGRGDASRLYRRDTGVGHRDSTFGAVAARAGAPAIRTPRSATDTTGSGSFTARALIADTVLRRVATLMVEAMDMTDT